MVGCSAPIFLFYGLYYERHSNIITYISNIAGHVVETNAEQKFSKWQVLRSTIMLLGTGETYSRKKLLSRGFLGSIHLKVSRNTTVKTILIRSVGVGIDLITVGHMHMH